MIDAHCHLDLYPEPMTVVREVVKQGVFVVSVTTTPAAWSGTKRLADGHDSIVTALGMHPQLVATRPNDMVLFESFVNEARWLGEIGLDGSPESRGSLPEQIDVFRRILKMSAKAGGRVLSIHSRGAASVVLDELKTRSDAGTPVLHWFSGSIRELRQAIEIGCWFSIGEPMVRTKSGQALLEVMPRSRVLTETDGPFVQIAGRPACPWDIAKVEEGLARCWQIELGDLRQLLQVNADHLHPIVS